MAQQFSALAYILGVRWAKSTMRNAIEDALFDVPDLETCRLDMCGGKLRCRALVPREVDPAEPRRAVSGGSPNPGWIGFDNDLPF